MATADVLADVGAAGRDAVSARLKEVSKDAGERMMLQEALDNTRKPQYCSLRGGWLVFVGRL